LLKILYAAPLDQNNSALYRLWALERLGIRIVPINTLPYINQGNRLAINFRNRLILGPVVHRFNQDVYRMGLDNKVDAVWADKSQYLWPRTLKKLRTSGIASVNYNIDNPFGLRRDPGWRIFMKAIPEYDLHVVQRDRNIVDYKAHGARTVIKIQTAYEPAVHFPPPADWSDAQRDREVSFIGTPYDQRAQFLTSLWSDNGLAVRINGSARLWRAQLDKDAWQAMYSSDGELYGDDYRKAIWRSKVNLSFITHSNQDEFAHKSFEIAACGGFLLVERSQGHMERFRENKEAVFFSNKQECAEKISKYLSDNESRERIAAAGQRRAVESGYSNDGQIKLVLEYLQPIIQSIKHKGKG